MNKSEPRCSVVMICGGGIFSGKEMMVLDLTLSLRERGVPIGILTSIWGNGELARRLSDVAIPYRKLRLGFISATLTWSAVRMTLHQLAFVPSLYLDYLSAMAQWRPAKCLHTNWHHLLLLLPLLRPERDDYWIHECMPTSKQYRWLYQALVPRIGHFICVSSCVADSVRLLGVPEGKIRIIYNGLRDPACDRRPPHSTSDSFNIGIVGQVASWKGHEDLLNALKLCIDGGRKVILHIFGSGTESFIDALHSQIKQLGISPFVVWHGFVSDRSSIFNQLDAVVAPSRFKEPFGLTAIEAGFSSLPVIVTRRGALPELVKHRQTGLVVEAEDPKQLAAAILELADNRVEAKELGKRARSHVQQHFSDSRLADAFLETLGVEGCLHIGRK